MLDDLLSRNLRLVVCGTGAGPRSALLGQYYAGPGNRFWRTLADVGLTPRQLQPAEYRELLVFGIGLTDLAKGQAGTDDKLRFGRADVVTLRAKMVLYQPRYLCFNGKRSYFSALVRGRVWRAGPADPQNDSLPRAVDEPSRERILGRLLLE